MIVTGPLHPTPGTKHLTRKITRVGTSHLRNLAPGVYSVTSERVRIRRRHGAIRRGAIALPTKKHLRLRVHPHRSGHGTIRYGTIVNPGVMDVTGHVRAVIGADTHPSAVVLDLARGISRGKTLSAQPSTMLPQGLLGRVIAVGRKGRRTVASLRPTSIYEVAPNMTFDTPLTIARGASASATSPCQVGGSGVRPFVHISNVSASGGWITTRVAFFDVKTGATIDLHMHAAAGVNVNSGARVSCSLPLPTLALQGMAGPIPIYGGIKPGADAEVAAGAKMTAEGSTNVTMGAQIGGIPPSAQPRLSFDSPKFGFTSELFATAKASLSLNAEVGIGVANAANLHLDLGNSLAFSAAPGNCSWDLDLGSFSAGGQLGPVSISTPSTPPLYHRNLWHRSCGAAPPPAPPAPPPVALPLTRATMSWDTDSDIDLYAWDQQGRLIAYFERFGIPDAELVEDVIPEFGEFSHAPEIFRETANPERGYTFGICDFRGEGADVTLDVVDPGNVHRTFNQTLFEAGDSAVITTSPAGQGFDPGFGWCNYVE